jgi:hypothetical protein
MMDFSDPPAARADARLASAPGRQVVDHVDGLTLGEQGGRRGASR